MQSNTKAFSAISYLSIFFAPFILPLIIYIFVQDKEAKHHAKRAFISHLLTIVISVILVVVIFFTFINTPDNTLSTPLLLVLIASILFSLLSSAAILIWNIIQAIKVAR